MVDNFRDERAELWSHLSTDEKSEVRIFEEAVRRNLDKFEKEPTAENKRNFDAARDGLRRVLSELKARYLDADEVFANRLEALGWLKAQGFTISKSKLYQDAKKGVLKVQSDKTILRSDVESYAKGLKYLGAPSDELGVAEKIRKEKEIEKLSLQIDRLKFELEQRQGEWIRAEDVEKRSVERILLVKQVAMSMPRTWAPRFVGLETARQAGALLGEMMRELCLRFAEG